MALTTTPIELSSTPSIVDGGNATAITIDSSENVTFAGEISTAGVNTITSNTPKITFIESDQSNKQYQIGSFGAAYAIYDASNSQYRYTLTTSGDHIFNEGGLDCDFRVESNNNTHILFIDGGNDRVNIGLDAPGSNSHKVVIQNESTVGTVNSHLCLVGDSATTGQGPQIMFSESGSGESFAGGSIGFSRTGGNGVGDLIFGTRQSSGDSSTTTTPAMRINDSGQVGIGGDNGNEIQSAGYQFSCYGNVVAAWFENRSSTAGHEVMILNRKESAGVMIAFLYNDAEKGTISQSGGTISYNAFMGSHYSESSEDLSNTLLGTVMETVDVLVENKYEDQKRLAKCKVSDTSESPNVYGVWIENNETGQVAALGASWCRINSSVTVSMGDLLVSNGDGTAKVQSDDIIRSKTIGKVTATVKKETYDDGSYVVPVVLYCG